MKEVLVSKLLQIYESWSRSTMIKSRSLLCLLLRPRASCIRALVSIGDVGGTHAASPVSFRRLILNAEGGCTPYPAACSRTLLRLLLLLLDSTRLDSTRRESQMVGRGEMETKHDQSGWWSKDDGG